MKSLSKNTNKLAPLSVLALCMGLSGGAFAATCTVTSSADPDAYITGARGSDEGVYGDNATNTGRYSTTADCGLGIGTNDRNTTAMDGFGGVEDWTLYGNEINNGNGSLVGWSATTQDRKTGTWSIDSSNFDDGTLFMLVLKDGQGAQEDGANPAYDATQWVWFIIGPDTGSNMSGDWGMYGRNGQRVENSHISLYTASGTLPGPGPGPVPEPGILGLLGVGLAGLALARRRKPS